MQFSKSKVFLISCICFIVGIFIASFIPIKYTQNHIQWFIGIIICAVLLILYWQGNNIKTKTAPKALRARRALGAVSTSSLFYILFFILLGLWRYAIALPINTPDKIWHYNGQKIIIYGNICKEPDVRKKNQKLEICVAGVAGVELLQACRSSTPATPTFSPVTGKTLITTKLYPVYNYNENIEVVCDLEAPQAFKNFDYDKYLARYDIYSICNYPEIRQGIPKTYTNKHQKILNWKIIFYKNILSLKNKLSELINSGLLEPEASLANAIILGYKKNIPNDLRLKFSQTGLSHIMAISGMHISILTAIIFSFFINIGFRRKTVFWLVISFLLCYIILIGFPASAVRAGLMGSLALFAIYSGRFSKPINLLIFIAALLLFINPKLLRYDISFQLSFLAVLGIILFYPVFNNYITKNLAQILKPTEGLMKILINLISITLAAQVLTLPIIAYNFSIISLISVISNLLILWTLPFLMIAILIALILSLILPNFIFVFFLPSGALLKYIITTINYTAQIPYSYIQTSYLWQGWVILYYFIVVLLFYYIRSID